MHKLTLTSLVVIAAAVSFGLSGCGPEKITAEKTGTGTMTGMNGMSDGKMMQGQGMTSDKKMEGGTMGREGTMAGEKMGNGRMGETKMQDGKMMDKGG